MLRWLLLAVLLCAGCMHPGVELLGLPRNAPPPDSNTDDLDEETTPTHVQTRITTRLGMRAIEDTACSLHPRVQVGDRERPIEVRAGDTWCERAGSDAIRMDVNAEPGGIVLVMIVPPGMTAREIGDLRQGLRDVRVELERRLRSRAFAQQQERVTDSNPNPPEKMRPSKKMLRASVMLWTLTGIVGTAGAIIVGVGVSARCCGGDAGINAVGGSILGFGAAPTFLAAVITLILAGTMSAGEE
jgi:hypothetical protein